MSFKSKFGKNWIAGLAGAVLAVLVGLFLHQFTVGSGLVNLSYDLLTIAKPVVVPTNAVLVFMDETSHEKLGQPLNAPWDRALHARLVDRLTASGAKAIVFDVVFSDSAVNGPEADRKLAEAFARSKRVIIAADNEPLGGGMKKFRPPIDTLRNAAAQIGSAEVLPSRDLIVRQHTAGPPSEQLSSLAWTAAEFIGAVRLSESGEPPSRWLQYYAPADSLPAISYHDALTRDQPDLFRDRVVFVGARVLTRFAGERKDEYPTPYTFLRRETPFISGVEIQATAFVNLVRADWWRRGSTSAEAVVIVLLGALLGYVLMQARPWSATAQALVASGAVLLASYALLRRGNVWFPWLVPVMQLAVVWVASVTVNSFRLYLERRLYEQTLALYLSPKLVKKFAHDEKFRQPGAEKQMITILFSDIANFTGMAEGMDSDDLAKLMNRYFEKAVKDAIHATEGTVVKYIGDAIFSFWNAPDLQADHAARACEAALRFRDQGIQHVKGQPLVTRIGLHTGVANVGNFGSVERIDYTALGESVNLASRMEGLNKHLGTTVLITGATKAETGNRFATRFLGRFRLKGFEKSVEVFELLGRKNGDAPEWEKSFDFAVAAFMRREIDAAEQGFRRVLELRKEDGPSRFYLQRIQALRTTPASTAWTGEVELREK